MSQKLAHSIKENEELATIANPDSREYLFILTGSRCLLFHLHFEIGSIETSLTMLIFLPFAHEKK
jgi:hypothetical protein